MQQGSSSSNIAARITHPSAIIALNIQNGNTVAAAKQLSELKTLMGGTVV